MKIVLFGKLKKVVLIIVGAICIASLVIGVTSYKRAAELSKANRSNAMQVAKQVTPEQVIPATSPDFFTEYRLERDKIRSERSDVLREIIKNAKNEEARQKAQDAILKMALDKQRESEMENLIKARGFADALVFIRDNSVSAVVKTTSLSREEVVQVADVISRVSGVKADDITISAKP